MAFCSRVTTATGASMRASARTGRRPQLSRPQARMTSTRWSCSRTARSSLSVRPTQTTTATSSHSPASTDDRRAHRRHGKRTEPPSDATRSWSTSTTSPSPKRTRSARRARRDPADARSCMNVMKTERLLLEPLDESRLEEFLALTADPDTMRYWAPGGPFPREVAERNFAASLVRLREHGFGRRWIVAKENGAGLGFTDTKYFGQSCDDVSPLEIGWMLTPRVLGPGVCDRGRTRRP